MSIGITYEAPETDEMGIRFTAREKDIELTYVPFRKVSASITNDGYSFRTKGKDYTPEIRDIRVILNRIQSKNRRLYAGSMFEAFGKHVVNSSFVEYLCFSKLRTLLQFWKAGIRVPRTVYVPCDAHDDVSGGSQTLDNKEDIADLIQGTIKDGPVVLKPDAGTHGRKVRLAKDRDELARLVDETEPSILNPVGVLAQEFVHKWFFDLRIIVAKKCNRTPRCYPTALARAGFKDFRTNTYLGNMVFGVHLPSHILETAVQCGQAIGHDSQTWVLALDAMLNAPRDKLADDASVKAELNKLTESFEAVNKTKRRQERIMDFVAWNHLLEAAYQDYVSNDAYENVRGIIEETIKSSDHSILFHEANACPEFWEQTRLIAGINVAEPLLECAESVIDHPNQSDDVQPKEACHLRTSHS
jgi:glutathione synthase/RimK-type ligase-like ATP-grasp enzyme